MASREHSIQGEDAEAIRASWQGDPFGRLRESFPQYSLLTSGLDIGGLKAPNRFVHEPMEGNDSTNGVPSELTLGRYRRLAEGHAGITCVEATSVGSTSRARINQLVIDGDHTEGIARVVDAFRSINDKTIFCVQLNHSGQISDSRFSEVVRVYEAKGFDNAKGRYLETTDIDQIVKDFINAARIAKGAGADMVDIKLCHGYLGGQLLRPANTRKDEYGGSLENRMRFAQRVIEGIKEGVHNLRIMVRFSMVEGNSKVGGELMPGGIGATGPDSYAYDLVEPDMMLRKLAEFGADVLNISAGIPNYNGDLWVRPARPPEGFKAEDINTYNLYHHLSHARIAKGLGLGIPIIASGFSLFGIDIGLVGENAIKGGYADMIGMGRQSFADPYVHKILAGEANYCVRCKGCSELLLGQMLVGCSHYDSNYAAIRNGLRLHLTVPWR